MRSWPQLLCSCLLFVAAACGNSQPRLHSETVPRLVERWESGRETRELVDARRGLLVLRYCAGEGRSCEHSTYRHCGESLRRATSVLREDLEMRKNYLEREHIYECGVSECRHAPMMEDDYEATLRFDTSVVPPVLIEVLHVEGAGASREDITLWADTERASHLTGCAERSS